MSFKRVGDDFTALRVQKVCFVNFQSEHFPLLICTTRLCLSDFGVLFVNN